MRGWRGFGLAVLGLTLFEVTVANRGAPERVGGVVDGVAKAVRWFLDPGVPAIGSKLSDVGRAPAGASGGGGTSSGGGTGAVPQPGAQPNTGSPILPIPGTPGFPQT